MGKWKPAVEGGWHGCIACQPCAAGGYRLGCGNASAGTCATCEYGKVKAESGQWDTPCAPLESCPAGEVRIGASTTFEGSCAECAVGHFKAAAGSWDAACKKCEACPVGQYRVFCGGAADGRCAPCPPGSVQKDLRPSCIHDCGPGTTGPSCCACGV